MAPPRPVVTIATTLRHFPHEGVGGAAAFKLLPDHFRKPIEELAAQPNLPWDLQMMLKVGGSVARERCRMATEFLALSRNDDDILLMVDFDLMPTGQDYADLLGRMQTLEVCGGLYTTREAQGDWVMSRFPNPPSPSGLLNAVEIGTGFKAFKPTAFRKVLRKNPWLDCEGTDAGHRLFGFFSMGPVEDVTLWPGRRRWLTEDYWFDWLCRDAGVLIVADTRIKLRHLDIESGNIYPAQFPPEPGELPPETKEL